jgi:anti-sigma B factor antagonist
VRRPEFSLTREEMDGAVVLHLAGELDLGAETAYRHEIDGTLTDGTLVLDLSDISFMDSTGLRLLLETDAHVRANGGRCVIVQGTGAVHRVIAQGLLESRLEVVERLEQVD